MNDSNNLEENLTTKVNELKVLFEELENDLIKKSTRFNELNVFYLSFFKRAKNGYAYKIDKS